MRKPTVMPLSRPIRGKDGTVINELYLPKNTPIFINLRGCNRMKAIWGEDAREWQPERWLSPLPESIAEAHVPGIYSNTYVPDSYNDTRTWC